MLFLVVEQNPKRLQVMLNITLLSGLWDHYHRSALAWQVSIVVHLVGEGARHQGWIFGVRETHPCIVAFPWAVPSD